MLKNILKEQGISTYKLAKDIDEPYSTVNDIVNGKVDINDCKVKILKKLSDYLQQPMEEIYKLCSTTIHIYSEQYDVEGHICVKHKKYFLQFEHETEAYDMELCKVTEQSSMCIKEVAKDEMEKILMQKINVKRVDKNSE